MGVCNACEYDGSGSRCMCVSEIGGCCLVMIFVCNLQECVGDDGGEGGGADLPEKEGGAEKDRRDLEKADSGNILSTPKQKYGDGEDLLSIPRSAELQRLDNVPGIVTNLGQKLENAACTTETNMDNIKIMVRREVQDGMSEVRREMQEGISELRELLMKVAQTGVGGGRGRVAGKRKRGGKRGNVDDSSEEELLSDECERSKRKPKKVSGKVRVATDKGGKGSEKDPMDSLVR